MKKFGETPLTRAELEEHCRCALGAARHACAEMAEDLNEATDAELVTRVMLARRLLTPALPLLVPREGHRMKRAVSFMNAVPEDWLPGRGRGRGSFISWLCGLRRVTAADITPRPS